MCAYALNKQLNGLFSALYRKFATFTVLLVGILARDNACRVLVKVNLKGEISLSYIDRFMMDCFSPTFPKRFGRNIKSP